MLTPRENLLSIFRRTGYEYVPVAFDLCPHLTEVYHQREHTDLPACEYFSFPWRGVPGIRPENEDVSRFDSYHARETRPYDYTDMWGVAYRSTPTSMHMMQMLHPLEDADSVEQLQAYPLPVFSELKNEHLAEQAAELKAQDLVSVGYMQCTIWETAWYIRGMENLMVDMATEDPMAEVLLDRITDASVTRASMFARAGVDVLYLGDDIGTQRGIMMSRDMYQTWLQPRLKKVISAARAIKPDILVAYHSCGHVIPFIPQLMDAGVDILNPLQPECMDAEWVVKEYGDQLSFHGAIGTQQVLPFGTPQQVRDTVFRFLDLAGEKGGMFPTPTHLVEPEVPWDNILAYVQACRDYRA